jgi:beta propeller repeat protein
MGTRILKVTPFILVLYLGLTVQTALGTLQEIMITNGTGDQQAPAVSGSVVVWEDKRSGTWEIMYTDVSAGSVILRGFAVASEDRNPSIWGNTIVWQAMFPGYADWDIVAADITTPTSPTFLTVAVAPADQTHPRIWGNRIVYQDEYYGDSDCMIVDISNPLNMKYYFRGTTKDDQYPAIWENIIAVQTNYLGDWDVLAWDATDAKKAGFVAAWSKNQQRPALYGNWMVWQDDYYGDWDITGNNISDPFSEKAICALAGNAQYPAVWNNVVVWQDDRNGNWDIYGYNLATETEFQITNNTADQTNPAISFSQTLNKYVVVWQDKRNGNWDIYGALLDGAEVAGCASPLKWDVNNNCVVDPNDVAEVQSHVPERNGVTP